MQRRAFLRTLGTGLVAGGALMMLGGCGKEAPAGEAGAATGARTAETTIRVGVTAGPHADIVTEAAKVAKERGLTVEVVEFTDYVTPDTALADGKLDLAVYQHRPFLENFNAKQNTDLKVVADAVSQPMGFYSRRIKSVDALPEGARVAIPNDPSNGGRALLLLEKAGLLVLEKNRGTEATVADIVENPKKLNILELEAAQLPRSVDDLEIAVIPMNYVISAGLSPEKDGFFFEDMQAPYALIIIASRPDNTESAAVKTFVESYRSPQVAEFVKATFRGAVKPSW